MASFIAIIRYALLETFFCISILAKTREKSKKNAGLTENIFLDIKKKLSIIRND